MKAEIAERCAKVNAYLLHQQDFLHEEAMQRPAVGAEPVRSISGAEKVKTISGAHFLQKGITETVASKVSEQIQDENQQPN